jgi:hypothetical protein
MIKQIWQHKKIIILAFFVGWAGISIYNRFKPLTWCSPKQTLKRADRAVMANDIATYRKLIYQPPEMSDKEFAKRIQIVSNAANNPNLHFIRFFWENVFGLGQKYTKQVILGDTAYVYSKATVFHVPVKPFAINILKKADGQWKILGTKSSLGLDYWLQEIKKDIPDSDAYYYLGQLQNHPDAKDAKFYSKNEKQNVLIPLPFNTHRRLSFLEKYIILNPNGFWAEEANSSIKTEKESLTTIDQYINLYNKGDRAEVTLWRVAAFSYRKGNYDKSITIFQEYLIRYPTGKYKGRVETYINRCIREKKLLREYFSLYPKKKIEIEARLGYKLFEQEKNSDTIENPPSE